MDFKDIIFQLSERVSKLKDSLQTEEATKTALVLPFIQALGYDVFNPLEVVPEYTCDIGTKKGEKIDYAIVQNGKPIVLIECKHCNEDLSIHEGQLLRYFHVSLSKFGILTNGVNFRFYTDLDKPNKMDEKPFLDINMLDLRENQVEELKKFHKSYFNVESILESASELKYTSELKNLFANEFSYPSPDFVKFFTRQIYDGMITTKVLDVFTELTKKSLHAYINDRITERLKSAIITQEKTNEQKEESIQQAPPQLPDGVVYMSDDGSIITTQEEIEAYYIVLSIVRNIINSDRIAHRDTQSYFSILIDDNNRKPVCRLYLNSPTNKRITFIDESKKEVHNKIASIDEIYNYAEQLINAVKKYL